VPLKRKTLKLKPKKRAGKRVKLESARPEKAFLLRKGTGEGEEDAAGDSSVCCSGSVSAVRKSTTLAEVAEATKTQG
jgi:hypothetical protein